MTKQFNVPECVTTGTRHRKENGLSPDRKRRLRHHTHQKLEETMNDNIRFVLSRMDKDGVRIMVATVQGRNTYATRSEAEIHLKSFLENNPPDIFGKQAIGTFEVSAVRCYPGHNDPYGPYIQQELNPGQEILRDPMKKIIEGLK
jgi:hypothetical protein